MQYLNLFVKEYNDKKYFNGSISSKDENGVYLSKSIDVYFGGTFAEKAQKLAVGKGYKVKAIDYSLVVKANKKDPTQTNFAMIINEHTLEGSFDYNQKKDNDLPY